MIIKIFKNLIFFFDDWIIPLMHPKMLTEVNAWPGIKTPCFMWSASVWCQPPAFSCCSAYELAVYLTICVIELKFLYAGSSCRSPSHCSHLEGEPLDESAFFLILSNTCSPFLFPPGPQEIKTLGNNIFEIIYILAKCNDNNWVNLEPCIKITVP